MQSGVAKNEKAGFVGYKEMNEAAGERDVSIKEIDMHGRCMRTESIAAHVNCTQLALSILWIVCKLTPEECVALAVEVGLAAKLLLVI